MGKDSAVNGIVAYACHLPRYVVTRQAVRDAWPSVPMAGRSRSVMGYDEDVITMASQAGLDALDRAGIRGDELAAVVVATASSPYVVKSAAAVVADYVGARPAACVLDLGAGTHAGLLALTQAAHLPGPVLVVGSDALGGLPSDPSDLAFGAGAAAYVLAPGGFAEIGDVRHRYSSYSNVWQSPGQAGLRRYDDERFDRTAGYAAQMAESVELFAKEIDVTDAWYAIHLHGGAEVAGVPADRVVGRDVAARTADLGCANALLNLGLALDRATVGETVVVQAYGAGAGTVTATVLVRSARPEGVAMDLGADPVEIAYVQYAKQRGHLAGPALPDFGAAFGASPGWERNKRGSVGLHAARCAACGSLNFPARDYCLDCRGQVSEDVALPRRAFVVTFNLQHILAIGPEEGPLPICTAVVAGEPTDRYGGKVAALITDADIEQLGVGTEVELVPRRGDSDDGLVQYGWKFRPVSAAHQADRATAREPIADGSGAQPQGDIAGGR